MKMESLLGWKENLFLGRKNLRELWIQLKIQEEEDLNSST